MRLLKKTGMYIGCTYHRNIVPRYCFAGYDLSHAAEFFIRHKWWRVIKIKGHTGWSGIGMTSYYETNYLVVKLNKQFKVIEAYDGYFGKEWRKGIQEIKELIGMKGE